MDEIFYCFKKAFKNASFKPLIGPDNIILLSIFHTITVSHFYCVAIYKMTAKWVFSQTADRRKLFVPIAACGRTTAG